MESESSLPCSQEAGTSPCHKPNTLTPDFLKILFNVILPSTPRSVKRYASYMLSDHNFVCNSDLNMNAVNSVIAHVCMYTYAPCGLRVVHCLIKISPFHRVYLHIIHGIKNR
jgi:hypothetical protein